MAEPGRRRVRLWALVAVVVVAAVAAAAVALAPDRSDRSRRVAFSQVEVQAYLEREAARTLPGLSVGGASCPVELPDEVGGAATCTVAVEGDTLRYEVQRLVGDRFEARPEHPVVLVRDIATAVRSKLATPEAEVACGGAAVVQPAPGRHVTCEITGGDRPRTVKVQVGSDGTIAVNDP